MKLEQQVCSLELAKKLKELGVKQESFFDWECRMGKWSLIWNNYHQAPYIDTADLRQYVSAFTVAELGEMLPWGVEVDGKVEALYIYKDSADQWNFLPRHGAWYKCFNDTEANARARMLVYLLENNLITL